MEELIQIKIEFYIQFVVPENLYPPDHAIHDHLFCLEGGVVIEVSPGDQFFILICKLIQKLLLAQNSGFRFFILGLEFAAFCLGIPDQSGEGILRKALSPWMLRTISARSTFRVSVALLSSAFTAAMWDFRRFSSLAYLA